MTTVTVTVTVTGEISDIVLDDANKRYRKTTMVTVYVFASGQ